MRKGQDPILKYNALVLRDWARTKTVISMDMSRVVMSIAIGGRVLRLKALRLSLIYSRKGIYMRIHQNKSKSHDRNTSHDYKVT